MSTQELLLPSADMPDVLRELNANELYALLREQTARYAMGDSSVRRETAEELLRSILYCIALHVRLHPDADVSLPVQSLYEAGVADVERMLRRGRALFHQAEARQTPIENTAYTDTLRELGQFFGRYDYHTFAHMTPCSIDYPLCHPVPDELSGVTYIDEYLRRLCTENDLLSRFAPEREIALLQSYCPDYRGLLINLYAPIAEAAIGRALLGKPVEALQLDAEDRAALLVKLSQGDMRAMLAQAAEAVCEQLHMSGTAAAYLLDTAADMLPRLRAGVESGSLEGVFFSLHSA